MKIRKTSNHELGGTRLRVSFLYYEECPSHELALERLREVMAEEGIANEVEIIKVETEEQAHAKIKEILRRACARTREALLEALGEALSAVSFQDAQGFFEHAGYHTTAQLL